MSEEKWALVIVFWVLWVMIGIVVWLFRDDAILSQRTEGLDARIKALETQLAEKPDRLNKP